MLHGEILFYIWRPERFKGTPCRENRRLRPLPRLFYFVAITSENNVKDHFGFIRGVRKWLRHICASCWTRLRKQEPHRENSSDCPPNAPAAKGSPAPSKKLDYFSPHSLHNTEAWGVPDVDVDCGSSASARDFLLQDLSPTTRSKSRLLFSCPSFSTQDNGFLEISPSRPSVFESIEHNSAVEANTSSQVGKIFRGENESLVPKIEGPSSHAVSLSGNDSSDSSSLLGNCTLISHFLLRLFFWFFCCSLKSEISKLSGSPG